MTIILMVLREDDNLDPQVWLDRLGRSLKDLIHVVEKLERRGANFKSVQENIYATL